jgi:hypothetical protein
MISGVTACIPDPRLRILFSLLLTDAGALVAACLDHEEAPRVLANRVCQLCVFMNGANGDEGEFWPRRAGCRRRPSFC